LKLIKNFKIRNKLNKKLKSHLFKSETISTTEISNFFGFNRKRWVVERTFSWLKRKCRRLLMRWERLANLWEAFSKLVLIYMWLDYLVG
jgi:transposase